MTHVDPGWWECDACSGDVRPCNAETVEKPAFDGVVTLAFCPDCWGGE